MKKILTILLVLSFFINSIPFSQFGKLVAFEDTTNNKKEEVIMDTTEGSNEIEYEITSLRGPNYKAFKTKDGMIEYNYYDENIHYLNEQGKYVEYNVTLKESNNSYSNIVNGYEVILPKNLKKDNIILNYQDDTLKIKYISNSNGNNKTSKKENKNNDLRTITNLSSKVEYKNVLKHTIIELIHTPNGLKENIILDKYIENYSFSYILETSLNLIYEQDTLYLYNKAEEEIFRFNPYNIIDNLGNIYYDVNLNIIKLENGYKIEVIPSNELLKELTYPVIIDPVITYSATQVEDYLQARYIRKNNSGSTEGIKVEKYIRYYEDSDGNINSEDISLYTLMKLNRSLLEQQHDLSTLKYGKITLKILSTTYENAYEIDVNEITGFYENSSPASPPIIGIPFNAIDGYVYYTKEYVGTLKRKYNVYEMDIADLLRESYKDNIILELSPTKLGNNENSVEFYGPTYFDTTKTPIITLGFSDNLGLANYLTYHTVTTDNSVAYINDCFGNLVIEQQDYVTNSDRLTFNICHYYNQKSYAYNYGYGYNMRISYFEQIIEDEEFNNDYYYILDATGRKKYYIESETTEEGIKYISEEGDDEYLLINNSTETKYKKVIEERYEYIYDNEGYLTKIQDLENENLKIEISYYGLIQNKRIKDITDPTGSTAKFIYTDSQLTKIEIYKKIIQNGQGVVLSSIPSETINYIYDDSNYLITTIYKIGEKAVKKEQYEYSELSELLQINSYKINDNNEEKLSSRINFEYENNKVIKYNSQIGTNLIDEQNIEITISYSNRTTIFQNNLGETTKYLFDYFGHTQTIIDNYGNTVFYKYVNYNGELYKDNPNYILKHQLLEVSDPINNGHNIVANHSFENGLQNWNNISASIDYISSYGTKALRTMNNIYHETTLIANQKILLETNKEYSIKALIKGYGKIDISSNELDIQIEQQEISSSELTYSLYEKDFIIRSTDERKVEVYINLYTKPTLNYVYFDQIQIDENNIDTTYNIIQNPSFEEDNTWVGIGGVRIPNSDNENIFGNFEMKIEPNSSISQTIGSLTIYKETNFSLGGFINTNGSDVEIRLTFKNTSNNSTSTTYVLPYLSYITDYQFRLYDIVSDDLQIYDTIKIEVVNTGKNPCYVDNLILTNNTFNTKYEYNNIGKITTIKTNNNLIEYKYENEEDERKITQIIENGVSTYFDITKDEITITQDNIEITKKKDEEEKSESLAVNNKVVNVNTYDSMNKYKTQEQGLNNYVRTYSYNYLYGLLTSVTTNNVTTSYEYDDYLRLIKTSSNNIKLKYTYDDFDNITKVSVLDPNSTELLSYYFEYNNHFDIESIYIGKGLIKEHLISYEYYYQTLSNNNKIYTGLIEKVIQGKNQDYYERYEYNENYNVYKTYIKKPNEEEQLISKVLYDNYNNVALYEDYIDNKTFLYNYDSQNRLISCLDQDNNGVRYYYSENQNEEYIEVNYIVDGICQSIIGFTYSDGNIIKVMNEDLQSNPRVTLDEIERSTEKIISKHNNTEIIKYEFTYNSSTNEELSAFISSYQTTINNVVTKYAYTYDAFGNITIIHKYENNTLIEAKFYAYNDKNELIIEGVMRGSNTILVTNYTYDILGNITSITRTSKQEEYSSLPYQIMLSYDDNINPTKLTSYTIKQNESSTGITYNVIYDNYGNIINDGQTQYTYDIDKLITITKNNKNIIYEYNSDGIRTYKKIINPDNTYEEIHYDVSGNIILRETRYNSRTNTTTYIIYIYDETGVVGFKVGNTLNNLTTYYFVKNTQNDIIEIIDINLNSVVKYTYDAYGNVFISGTLSSTIGELNPYRYRGYYYDVETQLFYCNSRYYSPELCRWISPDSIEYLDPESINGLNLYCYCMNNPIMYADPSGHMPEWLSTTLKIIGGVAIIAGCVVGSIFTGGALSVVLAGAAIGATAGGIGAGISTAVSGGDIHDFANAFLMSTATGAISGAVAASPLGVGAQIGINAALGAATYAGTQLLSGGNITLGGLIVSAGIGALCGWIGQSGWMQGQTTSAFVAFAGKNALKHVVGMVGTETLLRMTLPAFLLGGVGGGIYGRLSAQFNPNGNFIGI